MSDAAVDRHIDRLNAEVYRLRKNQLTDEAQDVLAAADKWLTTCEVGAPWQQSTVAIETAVLAWRKAQS